MHKFTISRDDSVYECFADVAKTTGGVLICTYRESNGHSMTHGGEGNPGFCHIVVRRSLDGGLHWGPREPVCETHDLYQGPGYNCSRLLACKDGSVLLIIDQFPPIAVGEYGYEERKVCEQGKVVNVIYRSTDDGATWSEPQPTSVLGIVPSIKELGNGCERSIEMSPSFSH